MSATSSDKSSDVVGSEVEGSEDSDDSDDSSDDDDTDDMMS